MVHEAGGAGGFLATWDEAHPERGALMSSYNIDPQAEQALGRFFRDLPAPPRVLDDGLLERLRDDTSLRASIGDLEVLAIPVRVHDRSLGFVCLLHPSNAARLLEKTPGVYNFRFDEVEVVVSNARLLQRLLAERAWLEAMVSQSANGVALVDAEGRVLGFNPAMERLSGWTLDEAIGRPASEVFPLRLEASTHAMALVVADTAPVSQPSEVTREGVLESRAGEAIDVEATFTTLRDDARRPLGWALTLRDVRERKAKERLERIFLSGVSHELQTPVAVIKGFSGLLCDPEVGLTPEQVREKAAMIHEESCRLERMVGQLLFATRLQAGGVELRRETASMGALLERVARRLEGRAREMGAEIEVTLPVESVTLEIDVDKIEQVVTNLVENAIKYGVADRRPHVTVSLVQRASEIEVSVSDEGPGVSSDERDRIFHVFERGRGATRANGSGLGLFICKSIVEAHGGRISVDGARGGGARFWFTLPRCG